MRKNLNSQLIKHTPGITSYSLLHRVKKRMRELVGYLVILLLVIGIAFSIYCGEGSDSSSVNRKHEQTVKLEEGNWRPAVKAGLETLISENAKKGKTVVFDFDNTIICRDIGEATFALMVKDKKLTPTNVSPAISPSFKVADKVADKVMSLEDCEDLTDYYEGLISATRHQSKDTSPNSNAYAWVVQIMAGMTPRDIVDSTEEAFAQGIADKDMNDPNLGVTKINGYLQPFFYPEMVDLLGVLLKNDFDVYIVSASNVWTVRWMVVKYLNPLIEKKHGEGICVSPDHVFGVSVLLKDKRPKDKRTDGLYKDPILTKENSDYANLDCDELANYELTSQIVYPLTGYYGKVANILKHITLSRPFLIAGDSPNDHPMLNRAENRLWITRLEKKDYQKKTIAQIEDSLPGTWLMQPVLYKSSPGFVSSWESLSQRLSSRPSTKDEIDGVIRLLKKSGRLNDF